MNAREVEKCIDDFGTEGIFNKVFKKDVKVTLLKSIKTGADKCVIEVQWASPKNQG